VVEQPAVPLLAMLGRFDEARETAARVRALFEESGDALSVHLTTMFFPVAQRLAGEFGEAEQQLRAAIDVLEEMGETAFLSTLAADLGRTLVEQGRYDEAMAQAERARSLCSEDDLSVQADWRGVSSRVLARRGQIEEAERLAREAVAICEHTDFVDWRAVWLMDLADVQTFAGRAAEARGTFARALELFEKKEDLVMASRVREILSGSSLTVS